MSSTNNVVGLPVSNRPLSGTETARQSAIHQIETLIEMTSMATVLSIVETIAEEQSAVCAHVAKADRAHAYSVLSKRIAILAQLAHANRL